MMVSFVRVRGQRDRIYAHRSDGTEVSWVFPSYGDGLPHDLVHLVVEAAFGLRHGFWGRGAAGDDPAVINDEANRACGPDKYRGFGADRTELLLAEGLAAGPWFDPEISDAARLDRVAESVRRVGAQPPASLSLDRVIAARTALEALRARWRAFGEKGTIRLVFDPVEPTRAFEDLRAELAA